MTRILDLVATIEFVADINDHKDCLMSQDSTQNDPTSLWFNIDIPKGHMISRGKRVRVIIETLDDDTLPSDRE